MSRSSFSSLVLVDSSAYFHRWFFAGGHHDVTKMEKFAVANVRGLLNFAKRIQLPGAVSTMEVPNKVVMCHEGTNDVRKELFGTYKANKNRSDVHEQWLAECRKAAWELPDDDSLLSLPRESYGGEADDLIADVVNLVAARPAVICSHDVDLFQLVDVANGVHYFDLYSKGFISETDIVKRTGVGAAGIVAYKTLAGDSGDNIPGIRGIGKKTAAALVEKYGTLDRIFSEGPTNEKKGVAAKLAEGQADAVLYERLIKIPICAMDPKDAARLEAFVGADNMAATSSHGASKRKAKK